MIKIDIEKIRKNYLSMTQSEFAKALNVKQEVVSKWEQNPENLRIDTLIKIADFAGIELSELIEYISEEDDLFVVDNHRKALDSFKTSIYEFLNKYDSTDSLSFLNDDVELIKSNVKRITGKPIIAFVGLVNAGKTTMINSLLGNNILPSGWSTNTSTLVKIKHILDKPKYMDKYNVEIVYSKEAKGENKKCTYDLLNYYATQQNEDISLIKEIVVYVDNEILLNCDFYDFPGFKYDEDEMKYVDLNIDALVYLSQANKFMNGDDITNLLNWIKRLSIIESKNNTGLFGELLPNLFIVASKAKTISYKNEGELQSIINDACDRVFENSFSDGFYSNRFCITGLDYNSESLRKRFFYYAFEEPALRSEFETQFNGFLEILPQNIQTNFSENLQTLCNDKLLLLDTEFNDLNYIYEKKEEIIVCLENEINNLPLIKEEIDKIKININEQIEDRVGNIKFKFSMFFDELIDVDFIEKMISDKYQNNDNDIKSFINLHSNHLNDELVTLCNQGCENTFKNLKKSVDDLELDTRIPLDFEKISIQKVKSISFNHYISQRKLFTTLAAAGGFFTGYSIGKYIKLNNTKFLDSSLIAGMTTLMTNPLTLGITFSVISTATILTLRNTGWKKTLSKRISSAYKKNNIKNKYYDAIDVFWEKFSDFIYEELNKIYISYQEYLFDFKSMLDNDIYNEIDRIELTIKFYNELKNIITSNNI